MYSKSKEYLKRKARNYWAVVTIQRYVRGYYSRRRVQYMVESMVDTGRRMLEKAKADWHLSRRVKAATAIQMCIRRYIRRLRALERQAAVEKKFQAIKEMDKKEEEARITKQVYQADLEKWFEDRKAEYDLNRMHDKQTGIEKSKIIAYRRRKEEYSKKEKDAKRQKMMDRADEEKIEGFIKKWEYITEERVKSRMEMCRRSLTLPETVEEQALKVDLQQRIKAHVKVVLRRADKQKIPMEIPEARDIATVEIIEAEGKLERGRAKEDMIKQANDITAAEETKKKKEAEAERKMKRRKRKWAATTLQSYYRAFLAVKECRRRAYLRYKKHFDKKTFNYFYENLRDHTCSWKKPYSLGSYDVDCEDAWVLMYDSGGNIYYYNPFSWTMSWNMPMRTVACGKCFIDFAVARLNVDKLFYCDQCLYEKCQDLINSGTHPEDILFKSISGKVPNSNLINPTKLPDDNWHAYTLKAKVLSMGSFNFSSSFKM